MSGKPANSIALISNSRNGSQSKKASNLMDASNNRTPATAGKSWQRQKTSATTGTVLKKTVTS
jgi:hypothetical protein